MARGAARSHAMAFALAVMADRFEKQDARLRVRSFRTWLARSAAQTPSRVIAWTQPRPAPIQETRSGDHVSVDPMTLLEGKRVDWAARWTGAVTIDRYWALLEECRRAAAGEDEWVPMTAEQMHVTLGSSVLAQGEARTTSAWRICGQLRRSPCASSLLCSTSARRAWRGHGS